MSGDRSELRPAALRNVRKIDPPVPPSIKVADDLSARDVVRCAASSTKSPGFWLRIGGYRVTDAIDDEMLFIVVASLAHRRDAYQ
jgi:mRNA-degrading endonuclease RelE of RelBE toxin-antitoxin system